MKRQTPAALQLAATILLLLSLSSCLKDKCSHTYTLYKPILKSLTEVRADMKSGAPRPLEQTGKIYIYGNYIFLNENNRGIHIIDNTNPSAPKNIAFINIPGNVDLAVKGNTLYADSYSDLVAFDISNPENVVAVKFLDKVFPHRQNYYYANNNSNTDNPDSIMVVAGWHTRDTTVECQVYRYYYENYYSLASADASGNYASPNVGGAGGSMARFTLLNDYLYTVSYSDLSVFDVSTPQDPAFTNKTKLGNWSIETIYPFRDKLFIGSNNGMLIYDASNPAAPVKISDFAHVTSCDPVIADDRYAYVTLRSLTTCQGLANQLDVINIDNLTYPALVKTYPMTSPHGLSKEDDLLFICDGSAGLKIYDASNVKDIKLLKQVSGLDTYDVIARNKRALVVAKDGLYQFDYADKTNIKLLSKIGISK